jgi:hypothetical protein
VAAWAAEKGTELDWVIPKEGTWTLVDCLAIIRDAPHMDEAYTLLNNGLTGPAQAHVANVNTTGATVKDAVPLLDDRARNMYPYDDIAGYFESSGGPREPAHRSKASHAPAIRRVTASESSLSRTRILAVNEQAVLLDLRSVTKSFGSVTAVHPLDLQIAQGEFLAILGPSGCGKTTLLRMIGGFLLPTAGAIHIGGKDVTQLGPERRPTNMVFQGYGLFPHMTVAASRRQWTWFIWRASRSGWSHSSPAASSSAWRWRGL